MPHKNAFVPTDRSNTPRNAVGEVQLDEEHASERSTHDKIRGTATVEHGNGTHCGGDSSPVPKLGHLSASQEHEAISLFLQSAFDTVDQAVDAIPSDSEDP